MILRSLLIVVAFSCLSNPCLAQQRANCPPLSADGFNKIFVRMVSIAERGGFTGCKAHPGAAPDLDCALAQAFVLDGFNYGLQPSALRMTWPALVTCYPRLAQIKSTNEHAVSGNRKAQQEKEVEQRERNEREKERNDQPEHVLIRTYYDYITLRKCSQDRKGYAVVFISDAEMERAKGMARAIEGAMIKRKPGVDKDALWKTASSESDSWQTETDKLELTMAAYDDRLQLDQSNRSRCQNTLRNLERRAQKITPEESAIKKDF